ncbi:MAG: Asp23/Gls24 family envelope stress response protein [Coriobacteriia bacterium]|nr:Asp23/Gls24 family envelope stress response protein [Coriobacteriia bacterium]
MSDELRLEGLGVAPSVLDTIVTVAAEGVEGIAGVGAPGLAGLVQKGARKGASRAVDVAVDDEGAISATVHVQVLYGHKLKDVANCVQTAVADAVTSQVGAKVAAVDVYVDGIVFAE